MNTCEMCRYWQQEDSMNYGQCLNPRLYYAPSYWEASPDDALRYWDAECYGASLRVGRTFGCVHWEPVAPAE